MSITTGIAAALGTLHVSRKKECILEPFKRTLQLANEEHKKAVNELKCATEELVKVAKEKKNGA